MPFCPHCGKRVGEADTLCRTCGRTIEPGAAVKKKGLPLAMWLLIGAGCLVLGLAILGIVSAIFVPNFVDALQKAKQKRTVADVRHASVVLVSYYTEHGVYPEVDTIEDLAAVLTSETGVEQIAVVDGWKRPIRYECWREEGSGPGCDRFRLGSAGRDGVFEHDSLADYDEVTFDPLDYDRDVIAGDGYLVQYPLRSPPAEAGPSP